MPTLQSVDRKLVAQRVGPTAALSAEDRPTSLTAAKRKSIKVQSVLREKAAAARVFCCWDCAKAWTNRYCNMQQRYHNNMLIDMIASIDDEK